MEIIPLAIVLVRSIDQFHHSLRLICPRYAEITAGIICGCMPAVPAFCRHFRHNFRNTAQSGSADHRELRGGLRGKAPPSDDLEMLAATTKTSSASEELER